MPIFKRPDGKLATDVPAARQIRPFIMRNRKESTVYIEQQLKDRLEDPSAVAPGPVALLEAVR